MKTKFLSGIISLMILSLCACGSQTADKKATQAPATTAPTVKATQKAEEKVPTENVIKAELEMTDGGVIQIDLYPDVAPISVENFIKLAEEGFYDNLIFHRVISGFMIQGGGFDESMQQKKAATIKGEFKANGVTNGLKHTRGVLSMARTSQSMDSASSQFFIMHSEAPHLDGQYAAFGKVTAGLDIVDKIASVKTGNANGMADVPQTPQVIRTIRILK